MKKYDLIKRYKRLYFVIGSLFSISLVYMQKEGKVRRPSHLHTLEMELDPQLISEEPESSVKNSVLEEFEQTQSLNQWTIPAIKPNMIYRKGMFDFISQKNIKTLEQSIGLDQNQKTIYLLNKQDLEKHKTLKYNYLHIGCIQVTLKYNYLHKQRTKRIEKSEILTEQRAPYYQGFKLLLKT